MPTRVNELTLPHQFCADQCRVLSRSVRIEFIEPTFITTTRNFVTSRASVRTNNRESGVYDIIGRLYEKVQLY